MFHVARKLTENQLLGDIILTINGGWEKGCLERRNKESKGFENPV